MEDGYLPEDVRERVFYTVKRIVAEGGNPLALPGPFFLELVEQLKEEHGISPCTTQGLVAEAWIAALTGT